MSDPITWTNEKRKLSDLIPWSRNPRQIKGPQVERLRNSFADFGQVETIAIGPGNEIYNGHQRLNVLMAQHGPDYVMDVRVASRALTEKERERLTIYLHKGAAGEWNFDILANEFEFAELVEWGFDLKELGVDTGDIQMDYEPPESDAKGLKQFAVMLTPEQWAFVDERVNDAIQDGKGVDPTNPHKPGNALYWLLSNADV